MGQTDTEGTLQLQSIHYGTLQLESDQVYHFPAGLVGFEHVSDYGLLPIEDTNLYLLHAMNGELSFYVIQSAAVTSQYAFEIDQQTVELLQAQTPEDVVPFFILNMIDDRPYVNMKAPVLLSMSSKRACQYILADASWPIRHPLFPQEEPTC